MLLLIGCSFAILFGLRWLHGLGCNFLCTFWSWNWSFISLNYFSIFGFLKLLMKNTINCWPKFSTTNHLVWNLLLNLSLTFIYFWPESCLLGKCLKIMFAKGQHWDKIICQLNEIANWWFSDSSEWTHNRITIMRKFLCAGNW